MMFSSYFEVAQKELLKIYGAKAKPDSETAIKPVKKSKNEDYSDLIRVINNITSPDIVIAERNISDRSGFTAETPDFVACRKLFSDVENIFSKTVPAELAAGAFHVVNEVNRKQLIDCLVATANTKKIEHFVDNDQEPLFVPAFIVALDSTYTLEELKGAILEIYSQENVDSVFEFDLFMVLGKGLIIKNWRERRSFIAIETQTDTLKWFYVLMNEYLETRTKRDVDLRQYIKDTTAYKEY